MYTICVLGQTGVGKTESAEVIAHYVGGEILNMDIGQMYTKIGIGTAKPNWKANELPHHLFDILDAPIDYSVVAYRKKVLDIVQAIHARGKSAVLVGGSLFYFQSLLFALHDEETTSAVGNKEFSWELLHEIDQERAQEIHPKDAYRIKRALMIWYATGKKPSTQKPFWCPIIQNMSLLWLYREKEDLENRINARLVSMIREGWYEEVMALDNAWQEFIHKKKLCGYNVVVDACRQHKMALDIDDRMHIKKDTLAYAKKQKMFWAALKKKYFIHAEKEMSLYELNLTFHSIDLYLEQMITHKGLIHGRY